MRAPEPDMLAFPDLKKTKPVSFAQSAKFAQEVARLSPGKAAAATAAVIRRQERKAARRGARKLNVHICACVPLLFCVPICLRAAAEA